jgi:threonylcarbamoyladenosine tRNA methylthiotransferase MtaB
MLRTVGFYTLGCKVNQYETTKISEIFQKEGYSLVGDGEPADVYVINTCTVTRLADRKSRQFIRRAKRLNSSCVIVVMGCYPQTNLDEIKQLDEIDIIIGTAQKEKAVEYVKEFFIERKPQIHLEDIYVQRALCEDKLVVPSLGAKTRALINIQNGCDRYCSYCVIPYARGPVRSVPLEDIVKEAQSLLSQGCKELVLTGINTALYGTEASFKSSAEGLHGIEIAINALNDIPGDFRIRLGSLEPTVVDAKYVERLLTYDKLCHHLHLSVQSGSNRILKAMNRNYTVADYLDIVKVVRSYDSSYGLTTDIIVGFPGETEADFAESLALIEKVGYNKVHGFQYSKRLFTVASSMENQISPPVKKERNIHLISLAGKVSYDIRKTLTGENFRILVEELVEDCGGNKFWKGHADNFVVFYIPYFSKEDFVNQFVRVIAQHPLEDGMLGQKEK